MHTGKRPNLGTSSQAYQACARELALAPHACICPPFRHTLPPDDNNSHERRSELVTDVGVPQRFANVVRLAICAVVAHRPGLTTAWSRAASDRPGQNQGGQLGNGRVLKGDQSEVELEGIGGMVIRTRIFDRP